MIFVRISLALFVGCIALAVLHGGLPAIHEIVGGRGGELLPWSGYRKHSAERPAPPHVEAQCVKVRPPSDATVLFSGQDLEAWHHEEWEVQGEELIAGHGNLVSRESFGDLQLHLEFQTPDIESEKFFNRGNSGVILMGLYEVQIFDSHPMHEKQIYPDGQCAAIYGESPPLVNASAAPGQWQSFDIIFKAPVFRHGELLSPATVTVFHNGVLAHENRTIRGPMNPKSIEPYKPHPSELPLALQGHGSPVKFRNIWLRRL